MIHLCLEHLGRTGAPVNRPQSTARGESAPRAPSTEAAWDCGLARMFGVHEQPALQ
jgi:hypothetical protein